MFRQRVFTFPQMAFAMGLGTAGGVYIYAPYFRLQNRSPEQDQNTQGTECPPVGGKAPVDGGGTVSEPAGLSESQNKE